MTTFLTNNKASYLYIILAILIFIAAPILVGIAAFIFICYRYWYDSDGKNQKSTFKLKWMLAAFMLTLFTLVIHNTAEHVTQYGFPTTVITYYNYPVDSSLSSDFSTFFSKLAFNPLQMLVNIGLYLVFFSAMSKIWVNRNR